MTVKYSVKKGDLFTGPTITVNHSDPTFDFTGCVIASDLRASPPALELLYAFVITPDFSTLGQVSFSLTIPGSVTFALPVAPLVADVVISRDTPSFGPYTIFDLELTVLNRITHTP